MVPAKVDIFAAQKRGKCVKFLRKNAGWSNEANEVSFVCVCVHDRATRSWRFATPGSKNASRSNEANEMSFVRSWRFATPGSMFAALCLLQRKLLRWLSALMDPLRRFGPWAWSTCPEWLSCTRPT